VLTPFSKNKRRQTVAEKDKTLSLLCDLSEMIFALFSRYKGENTRRNRREKKGTTKERTNRERKNNKR